MSIKKSKYYEGPEQRTDVVAREIAADAADAEVIKRHRTRKMDAIKRRLTGAPAHFFDGRGTHSKGVSFPNKEEAESEAEAESETSWHRRLFAKKVAPARGGARFPRQKAK